MDCHRAGGIRMDRASRACRLFVVAGLALAMFTARVDAAFVHGYELAGDLTDSLGGPSLVSQGGTLSAGGYTFAPNQGLSLSNGLTNPGDYTVDLSFSLSTLSGFRKILDFKNLASDNGLYNLNTALNFFPAVTGASGAFAADQMVRVDLTRDGTTNLVTGYVNGTSQFSFTDSSSNAVFSATNNIMQFLRDD